MRPRSIDVTWLVIRTQFRGEFAPLPPNVGYAVLREGAGYHPFIRDEGLDGTYFLPSPTGPTARVFNLRDDAVDWAELSDVVELVWTTAPLREAA